MPLNLPSKSEAVMRANPEYANLRKLIETTVETYLPRLAFGNAVYVSVEGFSLTTIGYVLHEIAAYHPDYLVQHNYVNDKLEIMLK